MSHTLRSYAISALLAVLAVAILFSPSARLPWLDDISDDYFTTAITKAGVAYAVTRGVNATVSVLQHSELQLEPAGLGVSIAAGQVLDPLNDMAERLSDILVLSLVSLGVQKLAYSISYDLSPAVFGLLVLVLAIVRLMPMVRAHSHAIIRILVCLMALRLLMPLCAAINLGMHEYYAAPAIEAASEKLKQLDDNLDPLGDDLSQPPEGNKLWNAAKSLSQYTVALKDKLIRAQSYIADAIHALLSISWWYIALFLMQAIVLPIASLLFVKALWRWL